MDPKMFPWIRFSSKKLDPDPTLIAQRQMNENLSSKLEFVDSGLNILSEMKIIP